MLTIKCINDEMFFFEQNPFFMRLAYKINCWKISIYPKTFSYNLRLNQNWRKINVPMSCEDWAFSHEKTDFSLLLCKNLNIFEETFRITWRNQLLNISKARADALFDLDNTWQDYWATVIGKSEFLSLKY